MRDQSRFWDRLAKKYAAQPIADEQSYQRKLAETQALLRPDWEILEVGCGTGNTAIAHAAHVAHVRAVDISDEMLSFGRARATREGVENISFERAAIDEIGTDRQYDAVLMLSLIHLIPDWQGALDKAWALTRPGGIFVSSTTCLGDYAAPLRWAMRLARPTGLVPPLAVFTPGALRTAIEARGFTIETAWQPRRGAALFLIARRP